MALMRVVVAMMVRIVAVRCAGSSCGAGWTQVVIWVREGQHGRGSHRVVGRLHHPQLHFIPVWATGQCAAANAAGQGQALAHNSLEQLGPHGARGAQVRARGSFQHPLPTGQRLRRYDGPRRHCASCGRRARRRCRCQQRSPRIPHRCRSRERVVRLKQTQVKAPAAADGVHMPFNRLLVVPE